MTLLGVGFCGFFICILLIPQGCLSQLTVIAPGPTQNIALLGDTVTLAVAYSGATNPAIIWRKGPNPIVTWTINSSTPPDIPLTMANFLSVSINGSLILENVTLDDTSSYSVEMTKSGQGTASVNFTLNVYEEFANVTLRTQPKFPQEGVEHFILQFAMARGVVEEHSWYFNGVKVKSNSHYTVGQKSLMVHDPSRIDTGLYSLTLRNPYSSATVNMNITVLYGPDDPLLMVTPVKQFYVTGDSLRFSCKADGFPPPTVSWMFGGMTLNDSSDGVLYLTNVNTRQDGVYTCTVINKQTKTSRHKNLSISVYEKPDGSPVCSVKSLAGVNLQYNCAWPRGTPPAIVSFPALSNSSSGSGLFSLNVTASDSLSGAPVSCAANHPVQQSTCNVTAFPPAAFIPSLRFGVSSDGKIRVNISCVSAAVPESVVTWLRGIEQVSSRSVYSISPTWLTIQDHNISNFLLHNYTCTCSNPLGVQQRQIHLLAPTISDSSLFPTQDGTVITLTWEVPPTSIVTAFDIQMLGPDLTRLSFNSTHVRSDSYRTIQQKPGSARSTDIFMLNPEETYKFRIIPKARLTEGDPSKVHRIGPGKGLSGSAIAGIAAGIPGGIILLLVPIGLLCLIIYAKNNNEEQAHYPITTDKGLKTKAELASNDIRMAGGINFSPNYNRLHQASSERSMALPMFVPPPTVRVATTV